MRHNGSGKSTTLKLLLGLLFPARGTITVLDRPATDVEVKARIGYLPEESGLYPFLSGRETLDFFGRLCRLDRATRAGRAAALLEMVGLREAQDRAVGEYSRGMKRRVGLAGALIHDPDLLILDEPTAGLDPAGARQVKDLVLELKARGRTVLLSSHLLADIEDVCDRVAILYGGRVRAEGTVSELLSISGLQLIETEELRAETIEKIARLLAAEEGKTIRRMERPREKLEARFLRIVEQARIEGAPTSGARTGGGLPAFLAHRDAAASPPGP
jgi:ABC-2 type transport system ATP-binding protein